MTLFLMAALPVLISLGAWQLDRAGEKRRLEDTFVDRIGARPVEPGPEVQDYQRLKLHGYYEPGRHFLVDNQTHEGAVGFAVVTSFRTGDGRRWLLNRGFLAGERSPLPEIPTPEGPVTVVGIVWPELGLLPEFGDGRWPDGWPKRVQRLEVARMAALLPGAVAREIRLEPGQPGVFAAPTLMLNMPASRHTGYAVQWFGLALVLVVGYIVYGFRRAAR